MKGTSFISLIICAVAVVGCSGDSSKAGGTTGATGPAATTPAVPKLTELKIEDVKEGTGQGAKDGDTISLLYRGTFANGTEFDGNMDDKGKPRTEKDVFSIVLGAQQVIKGWDEGLVGIKEGGERKLSIPAAKGYGAQASERVPANSDLYFTVKCLDIIHRGEERVIDPTDLKIGTGEAVKNGDKITIHYVGKLLNDKVFDSSREKNKPFTLVVGNGDAIPCIEVGVLGMKKGGIRRLRVPPLASLGAMPTGGVPPNSVTIFEIEVLDIKHK